jgi:hypothetical protein
VTDKASKRAELPPLPRRNLFAAIDPTLNIVRSPAPVAQAIKADRRAKAARAINEAVTARS